MSESTLESLIAYCRESQRVCPLPQVWKDLWEKLPARHRVGGGWEPPLPPILGAWHFTSNLEKMLRLEEHIHWAEQHGNLADVDRFLRNLPESDWHHLGE